MNAIQRRQQMGRIHAAKSALKLDDDGYRDLLESLTGLRSSTDMEDSQLNHVLDWLNWLSGRRAQQPLSFGLRGRNSQVNLIRVCYALAKIVPPGFTKSPMASMTWQERMVGRCVTHFELLSGEECGKLIEGMKAIWRRLGKRSSETLDQLPLNSPDASDALQEGCASATRLRTPSEPAPF